MWTSSWGRIATVRFNDTYLITTRAIRRYATQASGTLPLSEKAKAIVQCRISGTLSTVSVDPQGQVPLYGSIMPLVFHQRWYGSPLVTIRKDEKHYENIQKLNKASFVFFPLTPVDISPKSVPIPRVNMTGQLNPISESTDIEIIISKFEKAYPGSRKLIQDTQLFSFYEFSPNDVHYLESTGSLTTISIEDYKRAPEDPIAPFSRKLIENANKNWKTDINKICQKYGNVEVKEAFIFGLDRFGLDLLGKEAATDDWLNFRLPLSSPIVTIEEYQIQLEQLLKK